jgi:hypothetical protein
MSKLPRGLVAVGSLVALVFGMSPAQAAKKTLDHKALCSPENNYSLTIDNPYFPLSPGSEWVYFGVEDDEPLGLQITVLDDTENLYEGDDTIVTRVVRESEWVDEDGDGRFDANKEDLIEVSDNYFAQAPDGTVCYFGETVDIYEDGEVVNHDGSWRADGGRNAPGIFMPAGAEDLAVGTSWYMEVAPKVAKDRATFEGVEARMVGGTAYHEAIRITDCNTIDKDCGTKFYAPGVGLIVDNAVELTDFTLG